MKRIYLTLTAALVLLSCTKDGNIGEGNTSQPPQGMGELRLGAVVLDANGMAQVAAQATAQAPAAQATAQATTGAAAAKNGVAAKAQARAENRILAQGATLRLYAFKKGITNFDECLATRTYTIDATGVALLDNGQEPLYVPLGEVDIYLAGPVSANVGTVQEPQITDIAASGGIYPYRGVDLVAGFASATIAAGEDNELPAMTLTHKMALVQVVVEAAPNAVFENLALKEVKLSAQPITGSYTLDNNGGAITPGTTVSDLVCPQIKEETAKIKFSATTMLIPQPSQEFKIEATFECNQINVAEGDNHPTVKYRQSGVVQEPLLAATATRFTAQPMIPVEIKWRTKVLPWNDVVQDGITIPGGITPIAPTTPPTADQYVEIDGLKWAKGNLVAKNTFQCMVGDPSDYGVYFQFGSLVGWTGGANGTGTGQGSQTTDKRVWPIEMGLTKPTYYWQSYDLANHSKLEHYYFNYSANGWGTAGRELRDFDEPIDGDAGVGTLASGRYAKQGVGDPCTYYLGDPWRMPTADEYKVLFDNVVGTKNWNLAANWSWVTSPYKGAQRTGNLLYFPASGYRYNFGGDGGGMATHGYYWSSSVNSATHGYNLYFINSQVGPQESNPRSNGFPARCVSGTYIKPVPPFVGIDYTAEPANTYVAYPATAGGAMQGVKFNALKKPVARYTKSTTNPTNLVGHNPSTASADAALSDNITYQSGDIIEVTWQTAVDHGTTGGATNMVIESISLGTDGIATVRVRGAGNALLSYKRGTTILWNYHIWATDSDPYVTHHDTGDNVNGSTASGVQAKFMDRSLGALSAISTQPTVDEAYKYFGMLYQHGRPTPFTGQGPGTVANVSTKIFDGSGAEIAAGTIGGYTLSSTAVSTVTDAIQTPSTYYYQSFSGYYSWFSVDISTWSDYSANSKSIYDPCPYGYRVPINGSWNGMTVSHTGAAGTINLGSTWSGTWWPMTGRRNSVSGVIAYVGNNAYYWSSTQYTPMASYTMYFSNNGNVIASTNYSRSTAFSVRCVQEGY